MLIDTSRFGRIEVSEDKIINLEPGLLGFDGVRRYCLLDWRPRSPIKWLQAVDNPDLAFLVTDPFEFFPDYEIEVSDEEVRALGLADAKDLLALVILTVTPSTKEVTANLLGPILVNAVSRVGRQVVLQSEKYTTKHAIGYTCQQAA
ncbi:MAG: flagellar assembly protein FliW [Armatimonadota bacterium]